MNRINTHFTRLFALLLLGSTALLSGCADGPGNGGGGGSGCTVDCVPLPVACPNPGQTFTAFNFSDAKVTTVNAAGICVGCGIQDAVDVIDEVTDNYAIMSIPAGLIAAGNSITVTDTKTTFPPGADAGFIVSVPDAPILTLSLLQTITVSTSNNGTDTGNTATSTNLLLLDLLGLLNTETLHFVSAGTTTHPFNAARLSLGGPVNALTTLHVYGAGICE